MLARVWGEGLLPCWGEGQWGSLRAEQREGSSEPKSDHVTSSPTPATQGGSSRCRDGGALVKPVVPHALIGETRICAAESGALAHSPATREARGGRQEPQ